jgi:hypothetical protein
LFDEAIKAIVWGMAEIEPKPGDPIDITEDRESLFRLLQFFHKMMDLSVPQAADASKWLLASLLAVNGGSLVSFLTSDQLNDVELRVCAPLWLAGIMLALTVGVLNLVAANRAVGMAGKYISEIERALIVGVWPAPDWKRDQASFLKFRKWPWITGLASAACFLGGCLAVGLQML